MVVVDVTEVVGVDVTEVVLVDVRHTPLEKRKKTSKMRANINQHDRQQTEHHSKVKVNALRPWHASEIAEKDASHQNGRHCEEHKIRGHN